MIMINSVQHSYGRSHHQQHAIIIIIGVALIIINTSITIEIELEITIGLFK